MIELKKEQLDAINHENGDLLVSASAGSGKTFVMIERLIRLISQKKADVSEVLAVTFTESAASDMKEKLKKALIKEVTKTGDEYLLEQYKKVALADISTLHSFCSRLIRVYFYVAGVSHDFGILDDIDGQKLKTEAINKTFRYFYQSNDLVFKKVADYHAYKRSDKQFKGQIISLYDFFSTDAQPEELLQKFSDMYTTEGTDRFKKEFLSLFKEEISAVYDNAIKLLDSARNLSKPKLYAFIEGVFMDAELYLGVNTIDELYRLRRYERKVSTEQKLDDFESDIKLQAVEIRDKIKGAVNTFCEHLTDEETIFLKAQNLKEHADCIVKIVKKFAEYYTQLKREENLLDFDDLQHFALKVLSDETVLKSVKEKYKYIFVDEYQDVNGVQEEIINKISSDNVFMVGDVKQSIYGFRGCRPDFFIDKFEKMSKSNGKTALLNHSFRSANAVINTVNDVFSFCMTKESFGLDYDKTSRLNPGGVYKDGKDGRSQLHFLYLPKTSKKEIEQPRVYNLLDEIKEAEKDCIPIASLITKIINEETTKTYYDPKEDTERYITYKDIAVLTRKRENEYVLDIINGLKKHNIPVVSDASEDICSHPEIQVMINLLKLIDCFIDNVPLATVLKSPIGGFSDEDFANICLYYSKTSGKKLLNFYQAYEYYLQNADDELSEKLRAFDKYFSEVREISDFIPVHDVLNKVVLERNIEANLYAEVDGENKVKRLRKFIEFCSRKNYTVKEILSVITESKDGISYLPVEEADAVKVMTIHASKGLEFPVVIVCGMEKEFGIRHESAEFLTDKDDGVAIKLYDDDRVVKGNIWRTVFKKRMRKQLVTEEMRILYVALTRASYSLHMTFEGECDERNFLFDGALRFIDCVPAKLPVKTYTEDDFSFENLKQGTRKVIIGKAEEKELQNLFGNFTYRYPFETDTTLPLKSSVTALLTDENESVAYVMFDENDNSTSIEKGVTAHKFMENADFTDKDVFTQASKMVEGGIMTNEELSMINLSKLDALFKTDVFDFSKSASLFKEKSFIISIPAKELFGVESQSDVLLQGVIDLLVVDGNVAKVIDYKYSALPIEKLKEKYQRQLDLYAYAVEKVLGVKVTDKIIVSLLSGQTVKLD